MSFYFRGWSLILLLALAACAATGAPAVGPVLEAENDNPPPFIVTPPVPAPRPDRASVAILPDAPDQEQWETLIDNVIVRNVTRPAVYPVLPPPDAANGKAIIVVPGGGHTFVAMENEGFPVADRLASEGYSVFVLKYRTFETPRGAEEFLTVTSAAFRQLGRSPLPENPAAVDDLASAVEFVKARCLDFGCDGDSINVIGFSAGARTLIRLIENKPAAQLLNSTALLYPPMVQVVDGGPRPPMFIAMAVDDPLFRQAPLNLISHWLDESEALEVHLYAHGSHGFGTRKRDVTASAWINQYVDWLALYAAKD